MSLFLFSNYAPFWYITAVLLIVCGSFIDSSFPTTGLIMKCLGYLQIIEIMLIILWSFMRKHYNDFINLEKIFSHEDYV